MAETPAYVNIFEEAKSMYQPGGSYESTGVADVKAGVKKAKAGGHASAISSGLGGTTVMGGIDVASARSEARDIGRVKSEAAGKLSSISMDMARIGESARQAELGREFAGGENVLNRETQRYIADQQAGLQTRQLEQSEFQINQGLRDRISDRSAANYAATTDYWGNTGGSSTGSSGNYGSAPDLFAATPVSSGGGGGGGTPVPGATGGGVMSYEDWGKDAYASGKRYITDTSAQRAYSQYASQMRREEEAMEHATASTGELKQSYGAWLAGKGDTQGSREAYMDYWRGA